MSPSVAPSCQPSCRPSRQPTSLPTKHLSSIPPHQPSAAPSHQPTVQPLSSPTFSPSMKPTGQPSMQPTSVIASHPVSIKAFHFATKLFPLRIPASNQLQYHHRYSLPINLRYSLPTDPVFNQLWPLPTAIVSCHRGNQLYDLQCIHLINPSIQPTTQPTILPSLIPSRQPFGSSQCSTHILTKSCTIRTTHLVPIHEAIKTTN